MFSSWSLSSLCYPGLSRIGKTSLSFRNKNPRGSSSEVKLNTKQNNKEYKANHIRLYVIQCMSPKVNVFRTLGPLRKIVSGCAFCYWKQSVILYICCNLHFFMNCAFFANIFCLHNCCNVNFWINFMLICVWNIFAFL